MNGHLKYPAFSRGLRLFGIDPFQYFLLLDLFRRLSDRQEFAIRSTRVSRYTVVVSVALILAFISVDDAFSAQLPLRSFIQSSVIITALLLLLTLLTETIDTFLNPVEATVFAHQPVHERTYFAAKMTYLLAVVASIVLPLNVVPALAGMYLQEARWFFPITYLVSLNLLGVFAALVLCSVIGMLFRVLPLRRIRSVAAFMQAALFVTLPFISRIERFLGSFQLELPSSTNPLNWFVSLAAMAQAENAGNSHWPGILTMMGWGIFLALGIRTLSKGYLTNVRLLLQGVPRGSRSKRSWLGPVLRLITGRPSGHAAFSFIYSMAKTDLQFRTAVVPVVTLYLLVPIIVIARGLGPTPFGASRPGPLYIVPHMSGMAGLVICAMLTYSDQHRAAWIFLTAPLEGIRSFVRGVFWALWLPFSAGSLLLAPLYVWNWGIADALLFAGYGLGLGLFYVSVGLFLVDGLPFANPPKNSSGFLAGPLLLGALIVAGVIVELQGRFIFPNRLGTVAASLFFAGAACLIARSSTRTLETNVLYNLHAIAGGRTAMFQEVES